MSTHRLKPSPALVVALIALFVALGGTSYAAVTLPRSSVGTPQIKNQAVTKAKIAKSTFAALHGARGPAGPVGAQGPAGPAGPVKLTYVTAEGTAAAGTAAGADATCPSGMVATGGGVYPANVSNNQIVVVESDWVQSQTNGPPDTWEGVIDNTTASSQNFFVDAVCTTPTSISSAATHAARPMH